MDFAIEREQAAVEFYTGLAKSIESASSRKIFEEFAKEEGKHKAKLLEVKRSGTMEPATQQIADLKIGDYLVDVEVGPNPSYQELLILAMKREKSAFKLYTDLAASVDEAGLRDLLLSLAQEEAKHKLRFEVEYDDYVLTEN